MATGVDMKDLVEGERKYISRGGLSCTIPSSKSYGEIFEGVSSGTEVFGLQATLSEFFVSQE